MKTIYLLLAMLLFGTMTFAQETFVNKYTWYLTKENGTIKEEQDAIVTVVFNEKKTNDIVLYYANGSIIRYLVYGGVEKGQTKSGNKFQTIKAIDSVDGAEVLIQLFEDTSTLRIIIAEGWYIEFHI
jgi:hypothetical protein